MEDPQMNNRTILNAFSVSFSSVPQPIQYSPIITQRLNSSPEIHRMSNSSAALVFVAVAFPLRFSPKKIR